MAHKPVEYWITRATDPFVTDEDRAHSLDNLCERINLEADGAQISMKILAHKMLSPNQAEALNALKAVDACVHRCGSRVHNEVAKFRFLNQFVRLLSPKYNGEETSDDVKTQAVQMLFVWQKTMRYLPKFKQVYEMLKEQRVVMKDPELPFEPSAVSPPSKLATFEDEEKANLLSQLLKSKNKEDLQAANRLIKSMVRSEDQKIERLNKRANDLEKAKSACRVLSDILTYSAGEPLSTHEADLVQELFTTLVDVRPSLFRYAGEAAENDDSALVDILAVNDVVNKTVSQYKKLFDAKLEGGRTEELVPVDGRSSHSDADISLLNVGDASESPSPYDLLAEMPDPNLVSSKDDEKPLMAVEKNAVVGEAALIVMGSDTEDGSVISNLIEGKRSSALNDLSVLMNNLPANTDVESIPKVVSVENDVDKMNIFERDNVNALVNCMPYSLKSVSVTLNQLQLTSRIPITIFDEKGMKGMLCFAENPVPNVRRLIATVATITSSYSRPVNNVKLSLSCKNQDIETRLYPTERDSLPAFSPISALPTITQIFLILPRTNNFNSVDLDYVLLFSAPSPSVISGTFPVHF